MRLGNVQTFIRLSALAAAGLVTAPAAATTNFQFDGTIYYSDFAGMVAGTPFSAWGTYDENVAPYDGFFDFATMGGEFQFSILGQTYDMTDDERWEAGVDGPFLIFNLDTPEFFSFQMSGDDLLSLGGAYLGVYSEFGFFDADFFAGAYGSYALTLHERVPVTGIENGIPEPATWLMMLMGFGLAATATRRRTALAAL